MLPHVFYEDVGEALRWLSNAFGFAEYHRFGLPDGRLHGAMIRRGEAWVMLKSPGSSATSPSKLGGGSQQLMLFVEELEEHYRIARSAGVHIVEELHVTEYGEQQYAAQDPEGHTWIFARHVRDVAPEEWGAVTAGTP